MSSECSWNAGESPVAPDSTTTDRQSFCEGEDTLFHDEDGLFYFGTVIQVDNSNEKCLVQFGDDTKRWSHFRDLKKIKIQGDPDIACILCKSIQSTASDEILLCHYCRRGYHQNCHQPPIPKQFADGDTHWMCIRCVERRQARQQSKRLLRSENNLGNNNNFSYTNNHWSIPYDLASLNWDSKHRINTERKYCYCGQDGDWFRHMLQCCSCLQWFHGECVNVWKEPLLYGDRFFIFCCSVCNDGQEERIIRLNEELTIVDIAHLALYNLALETGRKYHDLDRAVLPFLETNLKILQPSNEIMCMSTKEWRNKILSAFWQHKTRFMCGREMKKKMTMWGLRSKSPPPFPPHLSSKSLRILKQWTSGRNTMVSTSSKNELVPSWSVKKRVDHLDSKQLRSESTQETFSEIFKQNAYHDSKVVCNRKLRVRQQRISSEESLEEEEDWDVIKQIARRRGQLGEHCGENSGNNSSVSALATPAETSGDETSSRGTLDIFIPPPKNFEGLNNPFCTLSTNHSLSNSSVFRFRPLKTRLSEKDIRVTKNGQIKRRRFCRKLKQAQHSSLVKLELSRSIFQNNSSFRLMDEDTQRRFTLTYSNPKDSVISYFGIADRVSKGEKYTIHARRILPKGAVQYLIEWEVDKVT